MTTLGINIRHRGQVTVNVERPGWDLPLFIAENIVVASPPFSPYESFPTQSGPRELCITISLFPFKTFFIADSRRARSFTSLVNMSCSNTVECATSAAHVHKDGCSMTQVRCTVILQLLTHL